MQTVAEAPTFSRQADKLFNEDERREPIDYAAERPLAWCPLDLFLRGRRDADLRASRLLEVRQDRP